MRRSLTKFTFLTKIIKISNICIFWGYSEIYIRLTSKHFCDNFLKQSKVKLLTRLCLKPTLLSLNSNIAFKTHYVFFAIAQQVNRVVFPMLLNSLKRIDGSILNQNYSVISRIYLFGDTYFNFSVNTIILNATIIKYLTKTVIFEDGF